MFSICVKECTQINRILYEMSLADNEATLRKNFLCRLKTLIPFQSASFYLAKGNLFNASNPVYYNCDEKFAELYNNELFKMDTVLERLCSKKLYVYNSTAVFGVNGYCDDFFINFMTPQGLHYTTGMNFIFNHSFLGFVVLFRGLNDGDFTKKDLFILYQFQKCLSHNLYNLTDSILGPSTINDMRKKFLIDNYGLTLRELDIIELVLKGKSNKEISNTLFIQLYTVKTHLVNIYRKLGIQNRSQIWSLFLK